MIPDLFSLSALIVLAAPVLLVVMLLPALLELRKPMDAGPRLIMTDIIELTGFAWHSPMLANIDADEGLDFKLLTHIGKMLAILPNLDS